MTPLEIKLSQAINDEIVRQLRGRLEQVPVVINTDQIAQVCTNTIRTTIADALGAAYAARRQREAAAVNTAIDEVTQ